MLPQKQPLELMQTSWASQLNPLIANPLTKGVILENISLQTGVNVINHKLGRNLQGWFTSRIRSPATISDQQDANQTPQLTLVLVASAATNINLVVF